MNAEQENKIEELLPLIPNERAEKRENYKKYLNEALKNDSITNIALSGNYGSGKSSILSTYFKNSEYKDKYLQISLANFKKDEDDSLNNIINQDKDDSLKNIEKNIINQILYQIPTTKIPLTNFKIKRELKYSHKFFFSLEILLILSLFFPVNLIKTYDFTVFKYSILSAFIVWNFLSLLKFLPIKRINFKFQNVETEIHNQNDELFEKYADEIVYLLEKSDKEILIIEDLDRFEQLNIFEKLRELNTKINNKLRNTNINKNRFIFIYAIKDDLFRENKDRTKFFDLIIPVIPYLNATNSYEKMKYELFEKYHINDNLLYILSYFIDDMRLLINIHNEFIVYKNEIINSTDDKDNEKLLSMIVCKNLFHQDFEKLKFRRGRLYEIFTSVEKYKSKIMDEINKLKSEINEIENERNTQIAKNEEDLFILWFKDKNYNDYRSNSIISFFNNPKGQFNYRGYTGYSTTTYEELKETPEYKKKLELVLHKETDKEIDIKQQISILEKKIKGNLKDLISEESINENEIILYRLISQGFIDENFENYINYNYAEKNENEFVRSIFDNKKTLSFDVKLKDFTKILNTLTITDFQKEAILNFSLLDYLINKGKIEEIELILKNGNNTKNHFIEQYYNQIKEKEEKQDIRFYLIKFGVKIDVTKLDKIDNELIENNLYQNNSDNFHKIVFENWNSKRSNKSEIIEIINNTKISEELIRFFIGTIEQEPKIELSEINGLYYEISLEKCIANPTFKNILLYYEFVSSNINEVLIDFINLNNIKIEEIFSSITSEKFIEKNQLDNEIKSIDDTNQLLETINNFFKDLVNENQIDNDKYQIIYEKYDSKRFTFEELENDLDKEKIQILINLELIIFSKEMLELLEKNQISYVSGNEKEISKILLENKELSIKDLQIVFNSAEVEINDKQAIFISRINFLSIDDIKQSIGKMGFENGDKLLKIAHKQQNYFNLKLEDNEVNRIILKSFNDKNIITQEQLNNFFKAKQ